MPLGSFFGAVAGSDEVTVLDGAGAGSRVSSAMLAII